MRNDWDPMTQAEFDKYCIDANHINSQPPKPSSTSPPASSSAKTLSAQQLNPIALSQENQSTYTPFLNVKYLLIVARHLFGTMNMI
jgi:hypothetical protein